MRVTDCECIDDLYQMLGSAVFCYTEQVGGRVKQHHAGEAVKWLNVVNEYRELWYQNPDVPLTTLRSIIYKHLRWRSRYEFTTCVSPADIDRAESVIDGAIDNWLSGGMTCTGHIRTRT